MCHVHISITLCLHLEKEALRKCWKKIRCQTCQCPKCSVCGKTPMTIPHAKQAPKTHDEVLSFKCSTCLYPACSNCGAQMTRKERRAHRGKQKWTCAMCQSMIWLKQSRRNSDWDHVCSAHCPRKDWYEKITDTQTQWKTNQQKLT